MNSYRTESLRGSLPRPVRALLYLAAGAAVAIPMAACQPQPAQPKEPAGNPPSPVTPPPPATTPTADGSGTQATPQVREVIVEKPVYIDRPVPEKDEVLGSVAGREIRWSQLKGPLLEGHGLATLLQVMQLELVKAEAEKRKLNVTQEDVANESDIRMAQLFPDAQKVEYPRYLDGFLQKQRMTISEWNLAMQINAYLRQIARSEMKEPPTEEQLQEGFNALYGENVKVRHIACNNMQEIAEAQRQLAAGIPFETVARSLSKNPRSAPLGGELPQFSRATPGLTPAFKEAAFALKEGEISDPVSADGKYHLIKMEKRIPPKAVKFEDVKDSIRLQLVQGLEDQLIKKFRQDLQGQAVQSIKVVEPTLKRQWDREVLQANAQAREAGEAPVVPTPK